MKKINPFLKIGILTIIAIALVTTAIVIGASNYSGSNSETTSHQEFLDKLIGDTMASYAFLPLDDVEPTTLAYSLVNLKRDISIGVYIKKQPSQSIGIDYVGYITLNGVNTKLTEKEAHYFFENLWYLERKKKIRQLPEQWKRLLNLNI